MSIVDPKLIYHRIHAPLEAKSEAVPLVLLHGLMGFAANWGKIWPPLSKTHPVLVLDQRGHGRSPKPSRGYGPSDYAGDLAALLDHIGWRRVHITGHSMGGRVALRFASLYPERTASLVMEDSGTMARPGRVDWIRNLLASVPTPFASRDEGKAFFSARFKDDPLTGGFLNANLEDKGEGTLDWRFHAPGMIETVEKGRAIDATKEFAELKARTLLVRGSKSVEYPASEAEAMLALRKNVSLVTIEGAGHFVHAEKPTEFVEALARFFANASPQ